MKQQWQWGAALVLGMTALPAVAAMQAKPVEWKHEGTTFSGVLVYDDEDNDKRPGLVMVPNWKGVNESAIAKAKQLAGDDYVLDRLFHHGGPFSAGYRRQITAINSMPRLGERTGPFPKLFERVCRQFPGARRAHEKFHHRLASP